MTGLEQGGTSRDGVVQRVAQIINAALDWASDLPEPAYARSGYHVGRDDPSIVGMASAVHGLASRHLNRSSDAQRCADDLAGAVQSDGSLDKLEASVGTLDRIRARHNPHEIRFAKAAFLTALKETADSAVSEPQLASRASQREWMAVTARVAARVSALTAPEIDFGSF